MELRFISTRGLVALVVISTLAGMLNQASEDAQAVGTSIAGQVISANETWVLADSPFYIKGNVTIAQNATLALEEGVELRFDGFYSIFVDGNLSAAGSVGNPIRFLSNDTPPSHGDWDSIRVNSTGNLTLNHCEIEHAFIGIHLEGVSGGIIENCTISNSEDDGIRVDDSQGILILNSTVLSNGDDGIHLVSSPYNHIRGTNASLNNGDGIVLASSDRAVIEDCNAYSNGEAGLYLLSSNNVSITNCVMRVEQYGIYLESSHNNTIRYAEMESSGYGAYLSYSNDNVIQDSTITNSVQDGIFLIASSYDNVDNCTVSSNGVNGIGIREASIWELSTNNTISGSTVSDSYNGISLRYSEWSIISGNVVTGNSNGIHLFFSSFNDVIDNEVSSSAINGILVQASSGNTVKGNTISENTNGVFVQTNSNGNMIHHNTVLNNTNQAFNNMSASQWDDGAEGNYWSDYNGTDMDGNGIGDEPYVIDWLAEDRYPLVDDYVLPFKVVSTMPEHNETNVLTTTKLTVTFSKPVDNSTLLGNITLTPNATIQSIFWINSNRTVILTLSPLSPDTTYTVMVSTDILDRMGRPLKFTYTFSFTTQESSETGVLEPPDGVDDVDDLRYLIISLLIFALQTMALALAVLYYTAMKREKK